MFDNIINYFSADKDRIQYFDIAKGIGIILVVWFHCNGPFSSYFNQFMLPLFFLISGLLYSQKSGVKEYVIRKVHNLYLPYIIWNLVFLVIVAIFENYTIEFFLKKAVLICFTLSGIGVFLGATWFIAALFIISILYKILENSFKESNYKDIALLIIFSFIALIGFKFNLPYALSRVLILGFFYAIGAFIKKHKTSISKYVSKMPFHFLLPIFGAIVFIIISSFNSVGLGYKIKITYPILFIIGALCASYFVISLSKWIENACNKIVSYLKKVLIASGQHSIDILIWHFIFFKIIIIIQMILNNENVSYSNLISHHPVFISSNGWWIAYLLVGVFLPLIWGYIIRQGFWGRALKKVHAVN